MKVYQSFLVINILVFVISIVLNTLYPGFYNQVIISGANNGQAVFEFNEYYRLITAIFLHGGFTHLAVNSFSLWQLGEPVEGLFGKIKFSLIYLLSGLSGSLFSVLFQDQVLSVGSSGAIFGLLGALLSWSVIEQEWNILRVIGINLVLNVYLGLTISNIDNFAHLGGFVGGVILGFFFILSKPKKQNTTISLD